MRRSIDDEQPRISRDRAPEREDFAHRARDVGLRQFMLTVYNYMASGLALTGVVAYAAAESGLYASLVKTPLLFWAIVLAPLAVVFFLTFRIENMSVGAAQAAFWAYAGLIGLSPSGVFLIYTGRASLAPSLSRRRHFSQ